MDCRDPGLREAVRSMIAEVEGKPGVNVGDHDGGVAATVPVLNTGHSRAGGLLDSPNGREYNPKGPRVMGTRGPDPAPPPPSKSP